MALQSNYRSQKEKSLNFRFYWRETTYYRAHVKVNEDAFEANPKFAGVELRPGMTSNVDIRTAKRTVLHFLGKPILRAFSGALTQR